MLRTFHRKTAWAVAAAGALVILSASQSLAAAGWTIVAAPPTGQNATLTSVAAVSVTAPVTPGNTALLLGVRGLALHWNGRAWAVSAGFAAALSTLAGASAAGVADISPDDAYAIGNSAATAVGSLVHWNGRAWSAVTLPLPANAHSNTTLDAISARGRGDVWIVGTFLDSATRQNETFSEHFNGTAWRVGPMPPAPRGRWQAARIRAARTR
jgi:hypothetical protein